jgi:hypothetical protein
MAGGNQDIGVEDGDVWLYLEKQMTGPVTLSIEVSAVINGTELITDFWDENAEAEAYTPDPNDTSGTIPSTVQTKIKWTVHTSASNVTSPAPHPMPDRRSTVHVRVYPGHNAATSDPVVINSGVNVIRDIAVPGLKLTDNNVLCTIMLHEFGDTNGKLDTKKILDIAGNLTTQQRMLLANYGEEGTDGRMVTFLTLQPRPSGNSFKMHIDLSGFTNTIMSNTIMIVYHCSAPGNDIVVVSVTQYIYIGLVNNHTATLFKTTTKAYGDPQVWLDRTNAAPPRFYIGSLIHEGYAWNQIFHSNGKNIMPGNFVHGMINTFGCWCFFRNFNWPQSVAGKFDRIYTLYYRNALSKKATREKLAALGYNCNAETNGSDELCSSLDKFFAFDRNFAYTWFMRNVAGISYYSVRSFMSDPQKTAYCDCKSHKHSIAHDHNLVCADNPDGSLEATLNLGQVSNDGPQSGLEADFISSHSDSGKYVNHFIEDRWRDEPSFRATSSLLTDNALGYTPQSSFAVPAGNLVDIKAQTWCDCYFYREDSLNVKKMEGVYIVTPESIEPDKT